ncbi:cytochrome P450 3A19-like [Dermacentor silvarum]|uniref:cytochrome P450 3A19-like n=1 Tax=Dermacentor silvarum TaxID=543639 RepID=UPI0021012682|nr:cytochrome P450 3A19-like [Dermacentor silvarum]
MSHSLELRTASNTIVCVMANIDNISAPLAFISYLLAEHPEVQDKVRAEVQALLDKDGELTYDGLGELTYLGQVLSESLRLYPPLPGSVRRLCEEDYEYNGVRILKGMSVSVPTLEVHQDPMLWPEPKKFDPERFSKANKGNIHPMSYFPYGLGPRTCIAAALSRVEFIVTIALLVTRYKLLPSGKYKDEPPLYAAGALLGYPKEGVWVKLQML